MKYKQIVIKEDNKILEGVNLTELAGKLGCDRSYLSNLRSGKYVCTYKFYLKIKEALNEKAN